MYGVLLHKMIINDKIVKVYVNLSVPVIMVVLSVRLNLVIGAQV